MSIIREMFDRVEQEHRTKLEQLNKMQEEQRYFYFLFHYLTLCFFFNLKYKVCYPFKYKVCDPLQTF